MSTCNRLDLQTLGSQPIMPKNLPDHCPQLTLNLAPVVGYVLKLRPQIKPGQQDRYEFMNATRNPNLQTVRVKHF
jgi:hypothetical protein